MSTDPFDCKACGGHFYHEPSCNFGRKPHRVVKATGFWELLLSKLGAAALTMPWRTVYVMESYLEHEPILAHERIHIEQIDRDGPIIFSVKYLWWLATKGYWDNPYEIEAYSRAPL